MTEYGLVGENNKFHRPLLYPPEGSEPVTYSRPSTLSKDLDSKEFPIPWEQATVDGEKEIRRHIMTLQVSQP